MLISLFCPLFLGLLANWYLVYLADRKHCWREVGGREERTGGAFPPPLCCWRLWPWLPPSRGSTSSPADSVPWAQIPLWQQPPPDSPHSQDLLSHFFPPLSNLGPGKGWWPWGSFLILFISELPHQSLFGI